ncbi:MAG: Flp pilus assembly complex ATPase component TadA [Acidobacteria bacterium]|nr:Flp pilus assembly complex ATPase component TadA [Acidobacteriota bacterium]
MKEKKSLGSVLMERGYLSAANLEKAIEQQRIVAMHLGELLLSRNVVRKEDLIPILEEVTNCEYFDAKTVEGDPETLKLIPADIARRNCAFPIGITNGRLMVVMSVPQKLSAIDELAFVSGKTIIPHLGFEDEILDAISRWYGNSENQEIESEKHKFLKLDESDLCDMEFFTSTSRKDQIEAFREYESEKRLLKTEATKIVSSLLTAAIKKKASDIHLDPQVKGIMVRLRIDGILHDIKVIPQNHQAKVISRIKILADMDIAERRIPQDGRILVKLNATKLDLRVATLPTQYGEKVVIRILDTKNAAVDFSELGFSPQDAESILGCLAKPQGMLLVCGPTGSGKTTTLYAAVNTLRKRPLNIITIEDPVEYVIEGINQVQVNQKSGRTFSGSLRSILRQDPNVIMVGEIRDTETAEIALTASQTGHLLLSTVHTNDSISAVTRLMDLQVAPFLIASSLTGVIAQRLVRKLCTCRRESSIPPQYAARLQAAGIHDLSEPVYEPGGCIDCDNTGFKGRICTAEMLIMDEDIKSLIRNGAYHDQIQESARKNGFRTLQEAAWEKVKGGLTSLDEIFRLIPFNDESTQRCHRCFRILSPEFMICPFCGTDRTGDSSGTLKKQLLETAPDTDSGECFW